MLMVESKRKNQDQEREEVQDDMVSPRESQRGDLSRRYSVGRGDSSESCCTNVKRHDMDNHENGRSIDTWAKWA
jgi:hypothetical protein